MDNYLHAIVRQTKYRMQLLNHVDSLPDKSKIDEVIREEDFENEYKLYEEFIKEYSKEDSMRGALMEGAILKFRNLFGVKEPVERWIKNNIFRKYKQLQKEREALKRQRVEVSSSQSTEINSEIPQREPSPKRKKRT